jgi:hypothetical protein
MDLPFHELRDRFFKTLESRIPGLSKNPGKPRIPRGAWIFPIALMLGVWANRGSREEGRLDWLRNNPPAIETWKSVLRHRGFGLIDDPAWREKAFAEMPDIGREGGATLISEDHTTFALRTEGDWLYFGLARNGKGGQTIRRELWERLGLGWEAIARFDGLEFPVFRTAAAPRIKGPWHDLRSLNY